MWISGGLKPDYRTIARFREKNKEAIKKILKMSVKICIEFGLVEGHQIFVDGSGFRGNASIKNSWDKRRCEEKIRQIEEKIAAIEEEVVEIIDREEADKGSLVRVEGIRDRDQMRKRIKDVVKAETERVREREDGVTEVIEIGRSKVEIEELEKRKEELERKKEEIEEIKEAIDSSGREQINTTDKDSIKVRCNGGIKAGYNMQVSMDGKQGMVVGIGRAEKASDNGELSKQVEIVKGNIGRYPDEVVTDSGYYSIEDIKRIRSKVGRIIIPSNRQKAKERGYKGGGFEKEKFIYDKERDEYICREGKRLKAKREKKGRREKGKIYQARGEECSRCRWWGKCTKNPRGRSIFRGYDTEIREEIEREYNSEEGKRIYKKRNGIEKIFSYIKRTLKVIQFNLRGRTGVEAEMSILTTCYNIRRMISIMGVGGLVMRLGALRGG